VRVANRDHRDALVWWIDGHHAKRQGVIKPGETFERSSFISHRWFCWPENTEGNLLTEGASLGEITLERVGEVHELVLEPRCIDSNGHCAQWKALGECERNRAYMQSACSRACGGCDSWGWLYPIGLARAHETLACWADSACANSRGYPRGGYTLENVSALRGVGPTITWLQRSAGLDARTRSALDRVVAPPPAVPATPLAHREASPPPPLPRDEL
jgi:hypothetical protein